MYTETDLEAVSKQLKRAVTFVAGILFVFLTTAFIFMTQWPAWIGTGFLMIGVCFNIFLWGMYGNPVLAYYRFVKDIVTGRTREMTGKVAWVGDQPIYKDNKLFYYEVWLDDEGVERVLYYDMNKGTPNVEPGVTYHFRIHENYVVEIMP